MTVRTLSPGDRGTRSPSLDRTVTIIACPHCGRVIASGREYERINPDPYGDREQKVRLCDECQPSGKGWTLVAEGHVGMTVTGSRRWFADVRYVKHERKPRKSSTRYGEARMSDKQAEHVDRLLYGSTSGESKD